MATTEDSDGLDREVDGRTVRSWLRIAAVIAVVTLGVGTWWTYGLDRAPVDMVGASVAGDGTMTGGNAAMGSYTPAEMTSGMGTMMSPEAPSLPAVFAWYDGEPIAFVHPEVSDAGIAEVLTGMMGSPVIVVPQLADVPVDATSAVHVFTNGIRPGDGPAGPLGFQADVFDSVPGDLDYSPLRRLVEVAWVDESEARELTSMDALTEAVDRGLVELTETGIVVNAPILDWPGGGR